MTELEAEKLFDGKPGTPVRFAVRGDDREREVTLTCEDPRLRTATMRITFTPRSPSGFTQKAETRVADEWQEVAGWIYTADR